MKILSETEAKVVNVECEFSAEERGMLFEHALNNIPREDAKNLLVEWAFIDILKKQMAEDIQQVKKQIDKEIKNIKKAKKK